MGIGAAFAPVARTIAMRRFFFSIISILTACAAFSQTPADWEKLTGTLNFYMVNDMGRNGYYDQKPIAELMGRMAGTIGPECVFAVGDIHHFWGVESTADPLWLTNYEQIYSHPELMLPWYPVLGNHEYRGNTQAVLDYAHVSRRWMMPARYYTKAFSDDGVSVRFVLLDTTPLIDRYRNGTEKYPDACKQDRDREIAWLDSVLTAAKEQWVVVMGHHPIYAETDKEDGERRDMQKYIDPVLRRHKVDFYACGHIHNFQHERAAGSDIDYVVNSAAALSRRVAAGPQTRFCDSGTGFSVISATEKELTFHFINKEGKEIYSITRSK